jgi:hypothetical protein
MVRRHLSEVGIRYREAWTSAGLVGTTRARGYSTRLQMRLALNRVPRGAPISDSRARR